MTFRICLLCLFVAAPVEVAVSQESPRVVESVLTSMKWADNLGSLELEVTTTKNSKSTLKDGSVSSFGETIEKFREFRKGDDFWIASAFGVTSITTKNGHDKLDESISMAYRFGNRMSPMEYSCFHQGSLLGRRLTVVHLQRLA